MTICFFHLMPYRFLPEDSPDRYRSVWGDVPRALFEAPAAQGLYHEFLDELEHAERCGFAGLCVNEHHQNADGLRPSPVRNTELFGREVLPSLRGLWRDYPDRSWPARAGAAASAGARS
jgi:hypothetical protein